MLKWIKRKYFKISKQRKIDRNIELVKLSLKNNTIDMVARHPEFVHFVNAVVEFFHEQGGTNYVSIVMMHEKYGEFECIVLRKSGKTMAEVNGELQSRIAELEAEIQEIRLETGCEQVEKMGDRD